MTRWLLAKTARTGDLAIGLIGPIFSFGRVEGDVRKAKAETKEQQLRYLQTVQNALREVDDSLIYNDKSRSRMAALSRHVAALQSVDDKTRMRFKGGSSTDLDVLYADRQLYASQNEASSGARDQYLALVSVFKALGGGWMLDQDKARASNQQSSAPTAAIPANPSLSTAIRDVTAP
jgi:multidrug efflux system outer membrane protein